MIDAKDFDETQLEQVMTMTFKCAYCPYEGKYQDGKEIQEHFKKVHPEMA